MKNNLVYFGHSGIYLDILNVAGTKFNQKSKIMQSKDKFSSAFQSLD